MKCPTICGWQIPLHNMPSRCTKTNYASASHKHGQITMGPRLTPLFNVHAIVEISPIEYILIFLKKKNIYFKKIWNLLHHPVTHYFTLKKNSGYEHCQFSIFSKWQICTKVMHINFLIVLRKKKPRIDVCVVCMYCVHSKKVLICCMQTLDCAPAFANPNS